MIDIAKLHRKSGSNKILGKFFATSGYRLAAEHLSSEDVPDNEITVKHQAHRGAVGISKVHPLIVIEYLRWVDYEAYAGYIQEKL